MSVIILNRNIVFSDSNQFQKSSLDYLASNLEDNDFKHLLSEFPSNQLEILKGKDSYPYEWVGSSEKFIYQELSAKECFYSSVKGGKRIMGNGNISDDQYLNLKNCLERI